MGNRHERRMMKKTMGEDYLRQLEHENAKLRRVNNHLVEVANKQAALLRAAENNQKLVLSEEVPDDEIYISYRAVEDYEHLSKRLLICQREFLYALAELRVQIATIDGIAVLDNLANVAHRLSRTDENLAAIMTRLKGLAPEVGAQRGIARLEEIAAQYIAGIQEARRDSGAALRAVIAETSETFGSLAKEMSDKARQGRTAEPKTLRLYEYTRKYKTQGIRITYKEVAVRICRELTKHCEDDLDREILADLHNRIEQNTVTQYLSGIYNELHKKDSGEIF